MDSTDLPVLWLRADRCNIADTAWKDVTGHGYDGHFYDMGTRRNAWLNYNPAIWFNGTDDSVRIPYNLDSLSEMSFIAVFVPADTSEAGLWGTSGALARNTLMTTKRVVGPEGDTDQVITGGTAALSTVLQNWRHSDTLSTSATLMVGTTGNGSLPPFKGALAELLVFDRSLDVLTQVQYETYLAIKYGIPLTKGNYVSAGQVVLWDANKNKDYTHRVTGLGRESYFSLHQKQSASVADTDSLLVLSRGDIQATNAANADSLADGQYLLWGDNNKNLGVTATPDGQLQMLNRGWLMVASRGDGAAGSTSSSGGAAGSMNSGGGSTSSNGAAMPRRP